MILLNILSSALRDLQRVFLRQVKSSAPFKAVYNINIKSLFCHSDIVANIFYFLFHKSPFSYCASLLSIYKPIISRKIKQDNRVYSVVYFRMLIKKMILFFVINSTNNS